MPRAWQLPSELESSVVAISKTGRKPRSPRQIKCLQRTGEYFFSFFGFHKRIIQLSSSTRPNVDVTVSTGRCAMTAPNTRACRSILSMPFAHSRVQAARASCVVWGRAHFGLFLRARGVGGGGGSGRTTAGPRASGVSASKSMKAPKPSTHTDSNSSTVAQTAPVEGSKSTCTG